MQVLTFSKLVAVYSSNCHKSIVNCRFSIIFFILFISFTSQAQFKIYPSGNPASRQKATMRQQETTAMPLPFWDDFSFSGTPADTLWSDTQSIDIVDGAAIRPPSVGAAVFDGLNGEGNPYTTDLTSNGFTDTLVSKPIRLAEVAIENRDSVFLSFVYQWKGHGEAPDPADYLQVDFKNAENAWVPVALLKVPVAPDPSIFLDFIQKVEGEEFFHNDFQFRISRYGRRSGPFDTWIVDYVYLNEHRFATDFSFPDRSISSPLTSLFGDYYAVPKDHFINNRVSAAPRYVYATQKNEQTPLNEYSYLKATNFKLGVGAVHEDSLDKAVGLFILPFGKREETLKVLPDFNNPLVFDPTADSTQISITLALTSNDNLSIYSVPKPTNADYDDFIFNPIDFRRNDSTQTIYTISEFYAYDDGEAEYSVGLAQAGNRAAYRFTQLTNESDTLTGVSVYFPTLSGNLSNIMNFQVYDDINGQPGNLLLDEVVPVQRPGVNVFQTIPLQSAVYVPSVFYIGWEQPANGTITIGLDRSADHADKLFSNSNGVWLPPSNVYGAVMMRPIFGTGEITTEIETPELEVSIFPNPVENHFTINQPSTVLNIRTVNGQALAFSQEQYNDHTDVQLLNRHQGLAVLQLLVGNKVITRKIVIR